MLRLNQSGASLSRLKEIICYNFLLSRIQKGMCYLKGTFKANCAAAEVHCLLRLLAV